MKRVYLSGNRDLPLLHFLWLWKVAPSRVLAEKFYPGVSNKRAYNRLNDLERAGVTFAKLDAAQERFLWSLTKKGYLAIRDRLPAMKEEGYRSEHLNHDLHVSAAHLGDYLLEKPDHVKLFTEQQLRRVALEFYPNYIPATESHRPDGYWSTPVGTKMFTTALEVELTPKQNDAYDSVGRFYAEEKKISQVLWIVPSALTAKRILKQFEGGYSPRPEIHQFVSLPSFKALGWQSKIEEGNFSGQSIRECLRFPTPCKVGEKAVQSTCSSTHLSFFDPRKSSFKTDISTETMKSEKAHLNPLYR